MLRADGVVWGKNIALFENNNCFHVSFIFEDMDCEVEVCFNCYFKRASHFQLRGLCFDSKIDRRYTMNFDIFEQRYTFKVS